VIGLNAQLLGTGGTDEAAQWLWLARLARESPALPVILVMHKPLFQNGPADAAPHQRYVPLAPRRRLLQLLPPTRLGAVVSGHTHQYLDRTVEGVRHLWVPSTAFYLPDDIQERVGEKIAGLGMLELRTDGCRFDLVCPDGVARQSALEPPVYEELLAAHARLA
jgi:hypothetical protein